MKGLPLFIHPFACPVEYLNQYSICFYASSNTYILQLRHFQPASDKIKYDQNFLTFKWWISANGFKAFEAQSYYLNTFIPNEEEWVYFLINFDLAAILVPKEAPPKTFIQPNAVKALSPKSLKELTAKKLASMGLKIPRFEALGALPSIAEGSKGIKKVSKKKEKVIVPAVSVADSEEEDDGEDHL